MTGQAYPAVRPEDVAAYSLLLPPLPEQRAIAAVLDSIDEAIERTEEVIAATERLRDALLHDLLTRGLPGHHTDWRDVPGLDTIPASWEVVRLGDVGRFVNGRAFKPSDWGESGLPIVRIQNLTSRDAPFNHYEGTVDPDNLIDTGDIVVSWSASIEARTWDRGPAVLNQHIFKAIGRQGVADKRFLYFLLDATTGELRRRVHGTTMQHVTKGTFDSTRVPLPPLSEQQAIAATLDRIDAAIERARGERAALQSTKASAADALLTGRVRVPNAVQPDTLESTDGLESHMNRAEVLQTLRTHREALAEQFGVTSLTLFGSVARDQATDASDIDILAEFGSAPGWREYFGAQAYLEGVLGRPVDLMTAGEVRPEIRPYVERDAINV